MVSKYKEERFYRFLLSKFFGSLYFLKKQFYQVIVWLTLKG
ncbi:hypothetical protein BSSC8_21280 [Bacillus subtilis subsp. subtilis str. SC-8]|nr:hypothetical protein BSSC8_21280 [Bacillus subtilis subsp. subtilis str. SC-8]